MKNLALIIVLVGSVTGFAQKATPKDLQHCMTVLRNQKPLELEHLSSADRADLEFCRMSETMSALRQRTNFHDPKFSFWRTFRGGVVPVWFDLLDVFCEFHPSAQYVDLFDNVEQWAADVPVIHTSREAMAKLFQESTMVSNNFQTFLTTELIEDDSDKQK